MTENTGIKIYQCDYPTSIVELRAVEPYYDFSPAQFCIVKKYELLYEKELERFKSIEGDAPYALPNVNRSIRVYKGIDREPQEYTPEDMDEYSVSKVQKYYNGLNDPDLELIFYRMAGSGEEVPEGLRLLGYDAGYLFGLGNGDGFSVICDCMFLCRWHGCDPEGTEFAEEFSQLNENGLFDTQEQAVKYLYHYLNQRWAEMGDFCVFEIYQ